MKSSSTTRITGIIFDIDGVIFDSRDANITYYNAIRTQLDLPPITKSEENYCHMASGIQSFERIIPAHLHGEPLETACMAISYTKHTLPLLHLEDNLLKALTKLKELGIFLGVCTNRVSNVSELLGHFGIRNFFSEIQTAGTATPKPSPDGLLKIQHTWNTASSTLAFLGDTIADEQAARAAGIHFWAYKSPDLNAEIHFTDFFSFIEIISPLVGK